MEILDLTREILRKLEQSPLTIEEKQAALKAAGAILAVRAEEISQV